MGQVGAKITSMFGTAASTDKAEGKKQNKDNLVDLEAGIREGTKDDINFKTVVAGGLIESKDANTDAQYNHVAIPVQALQNTTISGQLVPVPRPPPQPPKPPPRSKIKCHPPQRKRRLRKWQPSSTRSRHLR